MTMKKKAYIIPEVTILHPDLDAFICMSNADQNPDIPVVDDLFGEDLPKKDDDDIIWVD